MGNRQCIDSDQPVKLIKIDQSFVRGMLEDPDDLAIVKGVVGLANAFQRDVIAEGVETIAHGLALLQLGCKLAQGYVMLALCLPLISLTGFRTGKSMILGMHE